MANAFSAQFQSQQSEADRRGRPIQPWHIQPQLRPRAVQQAEEAQAQLTPKRRRNPLGVKIKR